MMKDDIYTLISDAVQPLVSHFGKKNMLDPCHLLYLQVNFKLISN